MNVKQKIEHMNKLFMGAKAYADTSVAFNASFSNTKKVDKVFNEYKGASREKQLHNHR